MIFSYKALIIFLKNVLSIYLSTITEFNCFLNFYVVTIDCMIFDFKLSKLFLSTLDNQDLLMFISVQIKLFLLLFSKLL